MADVVEAPTTRADISASITADLEALEKQEESVPVPETTQTEAEVAPEQKQAEPAPAAETPAAVALTDTTLVVDPADNKTKPWGEIKSERMRAADATRKWQEAARMRQEAEAMKAQLQLEKQQAELAVKHASLPALPDDDPYTQHMKAQQERIEAMAQYQATMQQQMQESLAARELEASRLALDAKEQQLMAEHKLDRNEIESVEREYLFRTQQGEPVSIDQIAKARADYLNALREAAVNEFKNKHRVDSPAANAAVPAAGTQDETPAADPRSRNNWFRDQLAALSR